MANTGVLPFIRGINFTKNDFSDDKFPEAIKLMTRVQWLTLDRTNLTEVPEQMGALNKLEHLSLKHNELEKLFGELTELSCLRTLNLRDNQIKSSGIPPELFKLDELTTLDFSHNKLKEVPEGLDKAKNLLVLNLSHNQIESIPTALFIHLTDLLFLDLSHNKLETLPPQTRRLANLQTLNLSNNPLELFQLRQLPSLQKNEINEISTSVENWQKLETFNLSRNELTNLPSALCKLGNLRRLFVNDNQLNFEGIPSGIGKLGSLEVFSAANNKLEMVPEGLCRCGSLKKLNLSSNRLITLPDAIHLLEDLDQLDLRNNPDLIMPPKPTDSAMKGAGVEFYNIDFSLQTQLRLAGANVPASIPQAQTQKSDPIARKIRLRRGPRNDADQDQAKILKGMKDIAKEKDAAADDSFENGFGKPESLKPKRWDESLEKPPLDYSKFFEKDDGQLPGLTIWEIENFLPNKIDEVTHGKFYEGDESDEFLALFDTELTYIEGGRTATGFYTVDDMIYTTRCYRVHSASTSIHMEPVGVEFASLDPRYVFVVDCGLKIYVWYGRCSKNTLKSKSRLLTEKINKIERKNKADLMIENQGEETEEFWKHVDENFTPHLPRLYQVQLGMGYLELPQIEIPEQKLTQSLLNSKNVYILDCYSDVFVWFGKKSTRLVRAAAIKLSRELFSMINRPEYAMVTRINEDTETQIFKSKFVGWDEVMAVDFTRTATSVAKTGADLTKWAKQQETKADLAALFMPRQQAMSLQEAEQFEEEWNYDLEAMESFVLEGKKFVRLPEEELGHFYTGECYVFLCRYCIPPEEDEENPEDESKRPPQDDEIQCVVYFWQGRDAGNMGWLNFTFTLQKKFKVMFGEELEKGQSVEICRHKAPVEFYHLRSNGGALCTRLIQISPDASHLNSAFCYILFVPFETEDEAQSGIVYVWIGSKAAPEESKLIQEIAEEMFNNPWVSLQNPANNSMSSRVHGF
uniref:Gelsolin-like domain-containing protein n=1 Tax=Megaselia scalaris TaxID=36166 RepID=T1GF46_MEGSC